jgi:hypothetical protein
MPHDLEPAGRWIVALVETLAPQLLDGNLAADASALAAGLRREDDARAASSPGRWARPVCAGVPLL